MAGPARSIRAKRKISSSLPSLSDFLLRFESGGSMAHSLRCFQSAVSPRLWGCYGAHTDCSPSDPLRWWGACSVPVATENAGGDTAPATTLRHSSPAAIARPAAEEKRSRCAASGFTDPRDGCSSSAKARGRRSTGVQFQQWVQRRVLRRSTWVAVYPGRIRKLVSDLSVIPGDAVPCASLWRRRRGERIHPIDSKQRVVGLVQLPDHGSHGCSNRNEKERPEDSARLGNLENGRI